MLCLNKKTGYGLMSLAYLAEHANRVCSAREIATTLELPLPRLMNLLKTLHRRGFVCSVRGSRGGYRMGESLDRLTLFDLVAALEKKDHGSEIGGAKHAPIQALQYGLVRILKNVKLADLILPGHRIDVPLERLCACGGRHEKTKENTKNESVLA